MSKLIIKYSIMVVCCSKMFYIERSVPHVGFLDLQFLSFPSTASNKSHLCLVNSSPCLT